MTITVVGKFYDVDDDGFCSGSDWDWVPFDEHNNDDDNMFDALLFAHQSMSNGDVKWLSIVDCINDVEQPHDDIDVLNHMMFWEPQPPITHSNADDWDAPVVPGADYIPFW